MEMNATGVCSSLNARGNEALKGCFHYTINGASYILSFFLRPSSKAGA